MHETHLFKKLINYLENEEVSSQKKIKKINVTLSEFAGLTGKHFMEHFVQVSKGTRWESLDIEFVKAPYGPELEITKIDFA
jgi:Zn finger protein HypA/HybF involved in hydrogenase expression